jgi:DNA polymerase III epsilon subunit-like protein
VTLAFVDVETTGTDPARHEVWEIALIMRRDVTVRHPDGPDTDGTEDAEYRWLVKPELSRADAGALKVGRFYQRTYGSTDWADSGAIALDIAAMTDGAVLVAANPAFDSAFLAAFLRAHGQCPSWDYHMTDIGSLVLGWRHGRHRGYLDVIDIVRESHRMQEHCEGIGTGKPYSAENAAPPVKLAHAAGIAGLRAENYETHTALGDARLVRDIYDVVTGHA